MFKITALFLTVILLTTCFPFDMRPSVKIKLDSQLIAEADEFCLTDSLGTVLTNKCTPVKKGKSSYRIWIENYKTKTGIFIRFKDAARPGYHQILSGTWNVQVNESNGIITTTPFVPSKFGRTALIGLFAFLVILFTKIPSALLVLWPGQKLSFLGRLIILNLLYVSVYILVFGIKGDMAFKMLIIFYLIILLTDFFLLRYWYRRKSMQIRIIASALFSNLVFVTLGHFILTFLIMYIS